MKSIRTNSNILLLAKNVHAETNFKVYNINMKIPTNINDLSDFITMNHSESLRRRILVDSLTIWWQILVPTTMKAIHVQPDGMNTHPPQLYHWQLVRILLTKIRNIIIQIVVFL